MMGWDFGEFLVERQWIKEEHLRKARQVQRSIGQPNLLRVLVDLRFVTQVEALQARAAFEDLASVDLTHLSIDSRALNDVPADIAGRHLVLPVQRQEGILVVATAYPGDILAEDDLRLASGREVRWVVASPDQIREGIARHYGNL